MTYTVSYNAYAGESVQHVSRRNVGRVVNELLKKAEEGESVSVAVERNYAKVKVA